MFEGAIAPYPNVEPRLRGSVHPAYRPWAKIPKFERIFNSTLCDSAQSLTLVHNYYKPSPVQSP